MFLRRRQRPDRGLVLLIALGMLSLFSVLIVSYIVFSQQQNQIAVSAAQRRVENVDPQPIMTAAVMRMVAGDANPKSPTFNADILGDLYGRDHLRLRVAHRRTTIAAPAPFQASVSERGLLLQPTPVGTIDPVSTLFKFPIHLSGWHNDGDPSQAYTRDAREVSQEVIAPLTAGEFGSPSWEQVLRVRNLPDYRLNDVFSGRLVTFTDGPLKYLTFRVVRSFGSTPASAANADVALASCLVIDLSEIGSPEIEFNNTTLNIYRVATDFPNALLYAPGSDEQPGRAGVDDDGNGRVDDEAEFGFPGSDDIGYPVLMNGVPFNGRGRNATGATGISVPTPLNPLNPNSDFAFDNQFGPELLPNQRITGPSRQAALGEPDEPYDAADFENWYLAWQPSDRRGILPQVAAATGLRPDAAPNVIPSYHRPSVINYLMHAPIWFDENGNGAREPSEFRRYENLASTNPADVQRLRILYQRIRAACFRPLNFSHAFFSGTTAVDLNQDGNVFDGAPSFNGSNPSLVLNTTIDTDNFATAYATLGVLATWMVNGPWDVDNDGDGIPDSIWIDMDLPTITLADGTVVRPLIAPLIEDLDGRINLNRAGTWSQFTQARFNTANPTSYQPTGGTNPDGGYFAAQNALRFFNRGGGVGPAEISFTHLFDEFRTGSPFQPDFFTQTSQARSDVLRTRAGNILQSRYGGTPWDFVSAIAGFPIAMPGQETGPAANANLPYSQFSDPLALMLHSERRDIHARNAPMGMAMDMHGRSTSRKDFSGNMRFDLLGAAVTNPLPNPGGFTISEVINQPYEFEVDRPAGNDQPFTATEFYSLVRRGTADAVSRRLTDLVGDVADRNEAIDRLLTFDSRSLDVVELPGGQSIVQFVMERLPESSRRSNPAAINEQIERVLAVELRKGSRLNLNRRLSNGINNAPGGDNLTDETAEVAQANPDVFTELAFPQLNNATVTTFNPQSLAQADYLPIDTAATTGAELPLLSANELLARNLYYLMFRLILDPEADPTNPGSELVPNFPYPDGMTTDAADVDFRNRYVAKRLAQWAANAVDQRDTNAIMTRLRYDPNPFDANGFDLTVAATHVVWGLERRELALTETLSLHNRRVKRNLNTLDPMNYDPRQPDADGEYQDDEGKNSPTDARDSDTTLDQFRIPEASTFVEMKSLRSPPQTAGTFSQESYPAELYDFTNADPRLDLGRIANGFPVWRLAVGYTNKNSSPATAHRRSALWVNEAERMSSVTTGGRLPDPLDGLTGAGGDHTAGDANSLWATHIRHVSEVASPVGQDDRVYLYDDDLDPTNGAPEEILLSRFVWFANLSPLSIGAGNIAGMRRDNVYTRSGVINSTTGNPETPNPLLAGGQYAVIAPRNTTILGSTVESIAPEYPYRPSPQRMQFFGSLAASYDFQYLDLGNQIGSPVSQRSGGPYRARGILPMTAVSMLPNQLDPARTDWDAYAATFPLEERVSMGFNISAPLPGTDYYDAPTHYINDGSNNGPDKYPFADGYRDYVNQLGVHADIPFDERPGAPLLDNDWIGVGDYQDVATLFLQRLADPTQAWDATNNPYITVDYLSMDLVVMSGDENIYQQIDPEGTGALQAVDFPHTPAVPEDIAFDTRRKIPDSARERPVTRLVPINLGGDVDLSSNYNRLLFAQRSDLMTLQSMVRTKQVSTPTPGTTDPYFMCELTSAWEDGAPAAVPSPTRDLNTNFAFQANQHRFDGTAVEFPQTLGFLNREFGEPAPAFSYFSGSDGTIVGDYVGYPVGVSLLNHQHLDRPFQSPYDLVTVPATSATRLNADFHPGTTYVEQVPPEPIVEVPSTFPHLLGFEHGTQTLDAADEHNLAVTPAPTLSSNTSAGFSQLTGARAGFEQIFDLVDTGPVSFGQRRWMDPTEVLTGSSGTPLLDGMFNRVVSTLRPPFNYVDQHRSEGKININTMPDYVRQGAAFSGTFDPTNPSTSLRFQRPLDAGERPHAPDQAGFITGIGADPSNQLLVDPINTSVLFGNGSVYRSIAWGGSTFYDLDDVAGEPIVTGAVNQYKRSVDSRFGLGFKAFIESRRGYASSFVNANGNWSGVQFRNLDLDFRYPSRFAGMFAPAAASTLPSVQRYLRTGGYNPALSTLRRTYDMSLMRPHPDFDIRLMDDNDGDDTAADIANDDRANATSLDSYLMPVEQTPPNVAPYQAVLPALNFIPNSAGNHGGAVPLIGGLEYSLVGSTLFDRSQAELHKNMREMSRDAHTRFQNTKRMANLTTHHSNMFMLRFTVGYFEVDANTNALGQEYLDPREGYKRPRGFYLIDRSIPVAYEPGQEHNAMDTIIFASQEQ